MIAVNDRISGASSVDERPPVKKTSFDKFAFVAKSSRPSSSVQGSSGSSRQTSSPDDILTLSPPPPPPPKRQLSAASKDSTVVLTGAEEDDDNNEADSVPTRQATVKSRQWFGEDPDHLQGSSLSESELGEPLEQSPVFAGRRKPASAAQVTKSVEQRASIPSTLSRQSSREIDSSGDEENLHLSRDDRKKLEEGIVTLREILGNVNEAIIRKALLMFALDCSRAAAYLTSPAAPVLPQNLKENPFSSVIIPAAALGNKRPRPQSETITLSDADSDGNSSSPRRKRLKKKRAIISDDDDDNSNSNNTSEGGDDRDDVRIKNGETWINAAKTANFGARKLQQQQQPIHRSLDSRRPPVAPVQAKDKSASAFVVLSDEEEEEESSALKRRKRLAGRARQAEEDIDDSSSVDSGRDSRRRDRAARAQKRTTWKEESPVSESDELEEEHLSFESPPKVHQRVFAFFETSPVGDLERLFGAETAEKIIQLRPFGQSDQLHLILDESPDLGSDLLEICQQAMEKDLIVDSSIEFCENLSENLVSVLAEWTSNSKDLGEVISLTQVRTHPFPFFLFSSYFVLFSPKGGQAPHR